MGQPGFFLLGYTNRKQVAFSGPYLTVEQLRLGFKNRKELNPKPRQWFAIEVRAVKEA